MTRPRRQQPALPEFAASGAWPPSWPGPTVNEDSFRWQVTGEYAGADYRLEVTAIVTDETSSATASATWGGLSATTERWPSADAAQRWAVDQVAGWAKGTGRGTFR